MYKNIYLNHVKRLLDFCFALILIIILCPVLLIITLLVRINLGSPVIFKQKRCGLYEEVFTLYKFRTMTDKTDKNGDFLPDEIRVTNFGKLLRNTSLDELPELFNILKGNMSLVGPRPLIIDYLPYYTKEEHQRHNVKPGLTGLAQVNGRNYLRWKEKFSMDLEYVRDVNFVMDCKILFKTFFVFLNRENIETASVIIHDGVVYQPLNVEREQARKFEELKK